MTDEEIAAILVQARANNVRHGLTGALIYHRGRFIQILEGPDDELAARFTVIAADPRHRGIHVVSEEPITERQFPDWTMGFRPLTDDSITALPGYDDIFDGTTGAVRANGTDEAQRFLEWLRDYWFSRA